MPHVLVRHKVADFAEWKRVFATHAEAQRRAGLRIRHVFRNVDELGEVFLLFEADTVEGARAFVESPSVPDAQRASGVVDTPDIYYLTSS